MREEIRRQLFSLSDVEYRAFATKLLPSIEVMIGVRLPLLRNMAKQIAKEGGRDALRQIGEEYFEEKMLRGFVIGYLKEDIDVILEEISLFLPFIDNWSVCDSFCSSLKIAKVQRERMWIFLQPYFQSKEEFLIRYALVMSIFYYVEEDYIDEILEKVASIYCEDYYVKMAVAWLLSICYIKFERKTEIYLEKNEMDEFTYRKTLQKIVESHQVSAEVKGKIREKRWKRFEK